MLELGGVTAYPQTVTWGERFLPAPEVFLTLDAPGNPVGAPLQREVLQAHFHPTATPDSVLPQDQAGRPLPELVAVCLVYNRERAVKLGVTLLDRLWARLLYSLHRGISTEPQIQMLLEQHKLTFRQILDFYRLVGVQEREVGERVKRGTFRPCVETLPTSTLIGCFQEHFGLGGIVAIGFFDSTTYCKRLFTYAPFDAVLGTAKLPLTLEYLMPREDHREITAEVYVTATEETRRIFEVPQAVTLGALRSKGFGQCWLSFDAEVQPERKIGYLRGQPARERRLSFWN